MTNSSACRPDSCLRFCAVSPVQHSRLFLEGDEEKAAGMTPAAMMDREKQHELPQLEVPFLFVQTLST